MASAQPGAKECGRTTGVRNEEYLNKEQCLDKKAVVPAVEEESAERSEVWCSRAHEEGHHQTGASVGLGWRAGDHCTGRDIWSGDHGTLLQEWSCPQVWRARRRKVALF